MDDANALFLQDPIRKATHMAEAMQSIEELTDAEIEETDRSAALFADMQAGTQPLADFLSLVHAFAWLNLQDKEDKIALQNFLSSRLGDPVAIAAGALAPKTDVPDSERFARLFAQARALMEEERFLNWQVAFPGIWQDWEGPRLRGGFDAVIGNPALGSNQAATGGVVRSATAGDCQGAASRRPQEDDRCFGGGRRPAGRRICRGERARCICGSHGAGVRRLSAAVRRAM